MRLSWQKKDDMNSLINALDQDMVVLASTDTVIGLFASLTEEGYKKLNQIKGRSEKPYLLVIRSAEMIDKFSDQVIQGDIRSLINEYWPGPMTIVVKAKKEMPDWMKSKEGTIALRVPNHQGMLELLKSFDGLFSTSANYANQPLPCTLNDVDSSLQEKVDIICSDEIVCRSIEPSTIIDISSGEMKVIRKGALSIEKIKAFLEKTE